MVFKKKKFLKSVTDPLALGALSTGALIGGAATTPLLPAGTVNPLTQVGAAGARFVGPIGTIGLTGVAIDQLKGFGKMKGGMK